ncbi:MAG: hypothetical protein J6K71_01950, partial [Clostridia bacterium]|nr:hypothetical protein [Clostridia bacterium]
GKHGFCKIESLDAHCPVVTKPPENLHFLERNLEQELYDNKAFKNYKEYYTTKAPDMMHLISKIRHLEFVVTAQNFNKENFAQLYKYLKYLSCGKDSIRCSKPTFCAFSELLPLYQAIDFDVQLGTRSMFSECLDSFYYGTIDSLKDLTLKSFMEKNEKFEFFKTHIPTIQNRNKFFTYYELLLYRELLNMNYSDKLYMLSSYKDELQSKIRDRKVLKELQKKQKSERKNSQESYEF